MTRSRLGQRVLMIALLAVGTASCGPQTGDPAATAALSEPTSPPGPPIVLTYFFYWYDANSGQHMGGDGQGGLATHPMANPRISWSSPAWYRKELSDMAYAGIDIALAVYWGDGAGNPGLNWSNGGLPSLVSARQQMVDSGTTAPGIGLFLDTSPLGARDYTKTDQMAIFYAGVQGFYSRIPKAHWGLVAGRPVIWVYLAQEGTRADQRLFDYVYEHFNADFGVRPWIVRDYSWVCAIVAWSNHHPVHDCSQRIVTDGSSIWGAAQNGYSPAGTVAAVGPGYDERKIPWRPGVFRPRDDGAWYRSNFQKALASGKRFLVIETWNEFHEASNVSESAEYGRTYIDLTRALVADFRRTVKG